MAKKAPDVMLRMKPTTYKAVKRFALVQGLPVATTITQLLDELADGLSYVGAAIEHAKKQHKGRAIEMMMKATGLALGKLGDAMEGKKKSGSR